MWCMYSNLLVISQQSYTKTCMFDQACSGYHIFDLVNTHYMFVPVGLQILDICKNSNTDIAQSHGKTCSDMLVSTTFFFCNHMQRAY